MIPGEYVLSPEPVLCNAGREAIELEVTNRGDRPVQVGSHFHFAEANRALDFDREAARGHRLDIPAGTAVRLEPGDATTVRLIPLGGQRRVHGFRDLVDGPLDSGARDSRDRPDRPAPTAPAAPTDSSHQTR